MVSPDRMFTPAVEAPRCLFWRATAGRRTSPAGCCPCSLQIPLVGQQPHKPQLPLPQQFRRPLLMLQHLAGQGEHADAVPAGEVPQPLRSLLRVLRQHVLDSNQGVVVRDSGLSGQHFVQAQQGVLAGLGDEVYVAVQPHRGGRPRTVRSVRALVLRTGACTASYSSAE